MLTKQIPSYLYVQYNDDLNLQAFVNAQNTLSQANLDWINALNLPIYTGDPISGNLLDWVGMGVYGVGRPALPTSLYINYAGPYNTFAYNTVTYNAYKLENPTSYEPTSDDVYKRCITWSFYKGDGTQFDVTWLKRRVWRFVTGTNGTDPRVDQTYRVSVGFGVGRDVTIRVISGQRTVTGGAIYNRFAYNTQPYNQLQSYFVGYPTLPKAKDLAEAIVSGVLPLPFQYNYIVQIT